MQQENRNFTISYHEKYDVIVTGGGPAGCTAAAAAAREGAKVLLLESSGCLGGMGTSGLVPAWCPFTDGERIIYGGLAERIFKENKNSLRHVQDDRINGWLPLNPELLKRQYDDLLMEAGVEVSFFTRYFDAEVNDNGTVTRIYALNQDGIIKLEADVFIDCSGDGQLAADAGAEFAIGTPDEGVTMPPTLCFIISNVDSYAFQNYYDPALTGNWMFKESPIWNMDDSSKYPDVQGMCCNLIGPGTVGVNAGHVMSFKPLSAKSLSGTMTKGRDIARQYHQALCEFFPEAFANSYLVTTGSLLGIRESRRIIGDYVLTADDYISRKSFKDEICRNSYIIDIHHRPDEEDLELKARRVAALKSMPGKNATQPEVDFPVYKKGESHGIPYRCLTPKNLKNVLVAGRSISCDRVSQSSIRVMPVCLCMGEAAGVAAALTAKGGSGNVHRVDTAKLRQRLREEGGFLPEV